MLHRDVLFVVVVAGVAGALHLVVGRFLVGVGARQVVGRGRLRLASVLVGGAAFGVQLIIVRAGLVFHATDGLVRRVAIVGGLRFVLEGVVDVLFGLLALAAVLELVVIMVDGGEIGFSVRFGGF